MSRKLMNLAMMMSATMAYASEYKNPFDTPRYRLEDALPKGKIPSDSLKCQPKQQREFTIKGVKIMAASKKDAVKKYNHRKK